MMRPEEIEAVLAVMVASARTPKELTEVALALMEAELRCYSNRNARWH
jgi:hypothetical protein